MHIFFCGIGGGGLGPLAQIAKQAGYEVSGSDAQESVNTALLAQQGIDFYIGQSAQKIAEAHAKKPIDWFVITSAITIANPNHPELVFAKSNGIRISLRDELLSKIISALHLKLIGVAGTHGKSTTTAMIMWLFHCLKVPTGHSVGASVPFAPMGELQKGAEYFVYECDEFDNNFLSFRPHLAVITGITWDHHEIFPTEESYKAAFRTFLSQSERTLMWHADAVHINQAAQPGYTLLDPSDDAIARHITLPGAYNRRDAWLAAHTVHLATGTPLTALYAYCNTFPGLKQRMEQLAPNLYSNYAHTAEKIKGGMLAALEMAQPNQNVVVIYEPLTNRRQQHIKDTYKDCFEGAAHLYWLPTYLAREDANQPVLTPEQLIPYITNSTIAEPATMNDRLLQKIKGHLARGDMVVAMGASGGGSLDEWLRDYFKQ